MSVPARSRRCTLVPPLVGLLLAAGLVRAEFGAGEPWMRLRPVLGEERAHLVEPGQTLHDVAYLNRLGFDAVVRLNPELDPWIPPPGSVVRLPTRFVLPPAEAEGLVVNLPEMRLYDFTGPDPVRVHAVAIGDAEDPTPVAVFRVGAKRENPFWNVPKSIRAKKPYLPPQLPPGEDNPLGSRWMSLGNTSYGIHGTNRRWSIGRGATHGCVRLYEDEMQALFARVPSGTRVTLIYETIKWGTNGKDLFVEVHPDLYARQAPTLARALELPVRLGAGVAVDRERLSEAVALAQGIPIRVGQLR